MDTKAVGAAGYVPWSAVPAEAGEGQWGELGASVLSAIPNNNRAHAGKADEAPEGLWEHFCKG